MTETPFILAQLTDPHIKAGRALAYSKVDTARAFEAAVAHVNALGPKVDAVIATGDLTDTGSLAEFSEVRPILDGLDCPYFVIPGNHDDAQNMRAAFADHAYLKDTDRFVHYVIDDFPLRLIGLDSTVPGAPHGELCAQRLAWLDAQLAAAPDRDTLIFVHHPPFLTGIDHMDVQNLFDAEKFFAVLSQHRQVRHIACGHIHRAVDTVIGGIGVSIGPNAAHAVSLDLHPGAPSTFTVEPPMVRLFRYAGGQLISHLSNVGHFDGPHPFFAEDGSLID